MDTRKKVLPLGLGTEEIVEGSWQLSRRLNFRSRPEGLSAKPATESIVTRTVEPASSYILVSATMASLCASLAGSKGFEA